MDTDALIAAIRLVTETGNHQFVGNPEGFARLLLTAGITGEPNPQFCPNWGRKETGHYGACGKCLNCLVRDGALYQDTDAAEKPGVAEHPVHDWFELSYAQFLTVPRLVMESMPLAWQRKMAVLLQEMDETFDWRPQGRYWVRLRDGRGRFTHAPLSDYRRGSCEHLRVAALDAAGE